MCQLFLTQQRAWRISVSRKENWCQLLFKTWYSTFEYATFQSENLHFCCCFLPTDHEAHCPKVLQLMSSEGLDWNKTNWEHLPTELRQQGVLTNKFFSLKVDVELSLSINLILLGILRCLPRIQHTLTYVVLVIIAEFLN